MEQRLRVILPPLIPAPEKTEPEGSFCCDCNFPSDSDYYIIIPVRSQVCNCKFCCFCFTIPSAGTRVPRTVPHDMPPFASADTGFERMKAAPISSERLFERLIGNFSSYHTYRRKWEGRNRRCPASVAMCAALRKRIRFDCHTEMSCVGLWEIRMLPLVSAGPFRAGGRICRKDKIHEERQMVGCGACTLVNNNAEHQERNILAAI